MVVSKNVLLDWYLLRTFLSGNLVDIVALNDCELLYNSKRERGRERERDKRRDRQTDIEITVP